MFKARLTFLGTEGGGYHLPFVVWPARVMIRFDEDASSINYGAIIHEPASKVMRPGESVIATLALLSDADERRFCTLGATFSFGDTRDRGLGLIIGDEGSPG